MRRIASIETGQGAAAKEGRPACEGEAAQGFAQFGSQPVGWLPKAAYARAVHIASRQPDLTFPDHTIQPVKLAPDPVLRFPVSQG